MSHKILRIFIVKVSVLGYFPLYSNYDNCILMNQVNIHVNISNIVNCSEYPRRRYAIVLLL